MPQIIEVPNYGQVEFPDGMSDDEITKAIQSNMPKVETNPTSRIYTPEDGTIKQDIKNVAGGMLKGASGIGNTIVSSFTHVPKQIESLLSGKGIKNPATAFLDDFSARDANVDSALSQSGVDRDSGLYSVGRVGTEIAGTAGVPKILATGAELANMPRLASSLKSGGFNIGGNTGNMAKDWFLRGVGGGAVGGASVGAVDPLQTGTGAVLGAGTPLAILGAGKAGSLMGDAVIGSLGVTTGAGGDAVREAFKAGKNGATAFLENMRPNGAGFDDVVAKAKQGLMNMKLEKNAQYRSGMLDISRDKSVLDFAPIDKAVKDISSMGSYKGVQIDKNSSATVQEIVEKVNEWKALDPAEYHTPEGLDALKQAISDIRDTTQPSTQARRAVDQVYNAVKDEITKQAPVYSKVMKGYAESAKTINELERTLSLSDKAPTDTSVRKLQSVLRNNAQTSYGNRQDLVNLLQSQGGVDVMPDLAGQALNSWMPRGMSGAFQKGSIPILGSYSAATNPIGLAALAAYLPLASPRLVGEAAYKAGKVAGGTSRGAKAVNDAITMNGLLSVPKANYLPLSILESQRTPR